MTAPCDAPLLTPPRCRLLSAWGRRLRGSILAASALALAAVAPSSAATPPSPFRAAARELGLRFDHFNGMTGELYPAETIGSGAALLDYDRDGDLDVYFVQGNLLGPGKTAADAVLPPPGPLPVRGRLFRNDLRASADGGRELRFTDVTEASGIRAEGYGMGAAVGDFDGDGWPDLYLTNYGPNQLWRNQGNGTFRDVTAASGTADFGWSTSASFLDYDRDGRLDLLVAHYVSFTPATNKRCAGPAGDADYCSPLVHDPLPDRLYHNRGDGTFEDVSARAGIASAAATGLGVVAGDYDGDGWIDVYVANDLMANHFWRNRGDGTFEELGLLAGCALSWEGQPQSSMGVDAGDFDGDGDDDLFMTHLNGENNTLYVGDGLGTFVDRSFPSGLAQPSWSFTGFGTAFLDYDNDGWLDLLVVNGAVRKLEHLVRRGDPYPLHQINQLFRNRGDGTFEEVTAAAGEAFRLSEVSRGAAFGDVDNDGDTDVVVSNNSGPARLLLNEVGNGPPWLGLVMLDATAVPVLGTEVVVERRRGHALKRRVHTDGSYLSAGDPRALFGLGPGGEATRVRATWPDGLVEEWPAPPAGAYHTLRRGTGTPVKASRGGS
jgi:hypothetical protein